jgi:uncharacterized repeat protein (TIGR01451 family)
VSWTETWYPVAGIGGINGASENAALRLERVRDELILGLYTPAEYEDVRLHLWQDDCTPLGHWQVSRVDPAHPVVLSTSASGLVPDKLSFVAVAEGGAMLGGLNPKGCSPPMATVESLPFYVTMSTFSVYWRGFDAGGGIADFDVQYRAGYDGDWVDWLKATTQVSATFTGLHGQTYFFRARARDRLGKEGIFADDEWGQAFTSVLLEPSPVLVTSHKSAVPETPSLGQSVTYAVHISNTGNFTAYGLALTDNLPVTLELISGTLSARGGGMPTLAGEAITWRGMLPPEQAFEFTYAVTRTLATPVGTRLTNTLRVAAAAVEPFMRWASIVYQHRLFLPLLAENSLRSLALYPLPMQSK